MSDKIEMTEEQKTKIGKLKKKFVVRGSVAVLAYISWLFLANLLTVMLNTAYVHDDSFVFLMTLGSTVLILTGLRGTIEEIHSETTTEMKKILGKE